MRAKFPIDHAGIETCSLESQLDCKHRLFSHVRGVVLRRVLRREFG